MWGKLRFGDGSIIIAKFCSVEKVSPSRVSHTTQAIPDHLSTCRQKNASGYIDQEEKTLTLLVEAGMRV